MRKSFGRIAVGATVGALCLALVATTPDAQALTAASVPFASADFHGYATGTEVHLGALTAGTTTLAQIDQAFSGASTSTAGLTTAITNEMGSVVQPTEAPSPEINSYGRGDGLEVGLGTTSGTGFDPNQIDLAGLAQQTAQPNGPLVEKNISIPANPILNATVLDGKAAAVYYPGACPIGQPLSYGWGSAADVSAADMSGSTNPVLDTAGTGTATAQSSSYTMLSPNSDGSYGLSSVAEETVAPLTINMLNLFTLQVTVAGVNPSAPITLTSHASGGAGASSVKLGNAGLVTITLTPAGGTPVNIETVDLNNPQTLGPDGFLHIPLSTSALGTDLGSLSNALSAVLSGNQVTNSLAPLFGSGGPLNGVATQSGTTVSSVLAKLANVSLGYINIDAVPHAIGGAYSTPPTVTATQASGAIDLLNVNLDLSGTALGVTIPSSVSSLNIANLDVGHLESSASLAAPVQCGIPVIKTADPSSVTAGQPFTYTISVPDPAYQSAVACDLDNMTVTDTISVKSGDPVFSVSGTSPPASVASGSNGSEVVTWTGLTHKYSDPPLNLSINVDTKSGSGVIQDTAVATATLGNCTGGASGVANIGADVGAPSNGAVLTGSYTLAEPGVNAPGTAPQSGSASGAAATPQHATSLPFTGAIGGLWQPFAGLGVLSAGGAALALTRKARRLR